MRSQPSLAKQSGRTRSELCPIPIAPEYLEIIDAARSAQVPFSLAGAFGLCTYTQRWRDTKDLDLVTLPRHRARLMAVVGKLGFTDLFPDKPYDRRWIYRSTRAGLIVDIIWSMANHRAKVDSWWLSGPEVSVQGRSLKIVPAEALLWDKLYILQRDRCDWPDVMNLLNTHGPHLDWREVLRRLGHDKPLLAGALSVYGWLDPRGASYLPATLWKQLRLPPPGSTGPRTRARLIDSRPWFGPAAKKN